MKKLKRLNLSGLSKESIVLDREMEQRVIGGLRTDADGIVYWSQDEFEALSDKGLWDGGYVDGWGYTGSGVAIFGSTPSRAYNYGSGQYYDNLSSYTSSRTMGWANYIAGQLLNEVPGVDLFTGYGAQAYTNTVFRAISDMMEKGYVNNSIYVNLKTDRNNQTIIFYNAHNGMTLGEYVIKF
jgi:hypothetical protein